MKKYFIVILVLFVLLGNNSKTYTINRVNYKGERVERASDYLISFANQNWIKNYEDGTKRDMYTFVKDDYEEYRFIGNDANNYVYFNCTNPDNLDSCELWRMIGVLYIPDEFGNYDYHIKLMKDEIVSDKSYYLSDNYWYTITSKYQNMIDRVIINDNLIERIDFTNNEDYINSYGVGINDPSLSWLDNNIYPSVYLKYDIVIESGNGSLGDAYIIKSMNNSEYLSEEDIINDYDNSDIIDVDNTGVSISSIVLYICIGLISIGLIIFVINFIKYKKNK